MGREIRQVPPNWTHPKNDRGQDQPMYNEQFSVEFARWLTDFDRVRAGQLTDIERECYPLGLADWLQDEGNPPDPKYYRPWSDAEATWFQVWETVSEGTPVTPPFETKAELVDYLATHGDFWDQSRGDGAWSREAAEKFVGDGWAPSMVFTAGKIYTARDGMPE
jgi:hypothetical protein